MMQFYFGGINTGEAKKAIKQVREYLKQLEKDIGSGKVMLWDFKLGRRYEKEPTTFGYLEIVPTDIMKLEIVYRIN